MRLLLVLLFTVCTSNAYAGSKEEKVRKLFEVQGIERSWQESMDEGRSEGKRQAQKMIDQVLSQLSPNDTFRKKFDKAVEKFINSLQANRTAKEIVEALIPYYAPNFSEAEIDQLIAFYSSNVARKDVEVSKMATKKTLEHFKEENEKIMSSATNEFVIDVQRISAECNCRTKK